MSGIYFAGFLADEDSYCLGESVRHHRVLSYDDVGLARGTADEKVVEHARSHGAIVMTRNWKDFKFVMQRLARSSSGDCQAMRCHEGAGLLQ